MQQLKAALESTSSHGLPRVVSNKPIYVRIAWLLVYLTMMALFLKGFAEFAIKLKSVLVTTSVEVNQVKFQFPDVYMCVENPISATYSADVAESQRQAIQRNLADLHDKIVNYTRPLLGSVEAAESYANSLSFLFPQSLPYNLLVNALAHRTEQTVLESIAIYKSSSGFPTVEEINPEPFYDPAYLLCFKWNISSETQANIMRSGHSAGLILTLMTDTTLLEVPNANNSSIESNVLLSNMLIPVYDWSLNLLCMVSPDRRTGVRLYLAPPGEYPTDFVTTFSLSTGKYHTVEIGMTRQSYKSGQFDCVSDPPNVQFLNPYDKTPYEHSFSYSYCYYYEYHSQFQSLLNTSGLLSPLPWLLKGMNYLLNISSLNLDMFFTRKEMTMPEMSSVDQTAVDRCQPKRPCSTLDYTASVSSVDWPTENSLAAFINGSIRKSWKQAQQNNKTVPALDFLMKEDTTTVGSYVRKNLLKVHFKPASVLCSGVSFSRDYGLSNFVSDIGGIMGIYLGMSLMTLCELFELIFDLLFSTKRNNETSPSLPKLESAENSSV